MRGQARITEECRCVRGQGCGCVRGHGRGCVCSKGRRYVHGQGPCIKGAMGRQICRSRAEKVKGVMSGQICRSRAEKVRWVGKFAGVVYTRWVRVAPVGGCGCHRRPGRGQVWARAPAPRRAPACVRRRAPACAVRRRMRACAHVRRRAHARQGRTIFVTRCAALFRSPGSVARRGRAADGTAVAKTIAMRRNPKIISNTARVCAWPWARVHVQQGAQVRAWPRAVHKRCDG